MEFCVRLGRTSLSWMNYYLNYVYSCPSFPVLAQQYYIWSGKCIFSWLANQLQWKWEILLNTLTKIFKKIVKNKSLKLFKVEFQFKIKFTRLKPLSFSSQFTHETSKSEMKLSWHSLTAANTLRCQHMASLELPELSYPSSYQINLRQGGPSWLMKNSWLLH